MRVDNGINGDAQRSNNDMVIIFKVYDTKEYDWNFMIQTINQ